MSVNIGDSDLGTRPPVTPPREMIPVRRRAPVPWWWSLLAIAIIIAGVTIGVVLTDDGTEPVALPTSVDMMQEEYANDSSLVVYEPAFYTASFFVGTEAGLDPDAPAWFQIEFARDTPLVILEPGFYDVSFFVGTDAGLDADVPGWYQAEHDQDTSMVIYEAPAHTFWIGTSGSNMGSDN